MKNREKFAKEIMDIACAGERLAFDKKANEVSSCSMTNCKVCAFYLCDTSCNDKIKEWCNSEYTEPEVDWSKVPVDTPILVSDSKRIDWYKRYFLKYKDDMVYTYSCGATSWSSDGCEVPWEYAKLANEEDVRKYAK